MSYTEAGAQRVEQLERQVATLTAEQTRLRAALEWTFSHLKTPAMRTVGNAYWWDNYDKAFAALQPPTPREEPKP